MLYDIDGKEVYEEEMKKVKKNIENKRKQMIERGKARNNW